MPRASGLFASLFEEARADQPEGHLGMELLRIRRCFDELDPGALVVVDEPWKRSSSYRTVPGAAVSATSSQGRPAKNEEVARHRTHRLRPRAPFLP